MVVKVFQPVDHQFESFSRFGAELQNLKLDVFAPGIEKWNSEQWVNVD